MTAHHIRLDIDGEGIATLTIDRGEKRNAMTYAMLGAFHEAIARVGADPAARVLIVTGVPGSFCAGTDLSDLQDTPSDQRGSRSGTRSSGSDALAWPLMRLPKPVIGAIDGAAMGMGAEFTSQCDVRIMSTRARIAWNFGQRGLVPDTGAGSWLLPRLIGPQRALRLLFSAAFLEAEEALRIGYAHQVVEPEALQEAARAEARLYLKTSPFSAARAKELVWKGLERDVAEHMTHHLAAMAECFASEDHKEGVASFLERRPAVFTGR
ncbi:MAG: enoyl-CoA hydratase/isomerase family protein [Phenylobacterium sp.]|uniref:enoyl-CoA hydratase/isomerase family protein n=1 Tax=Phenylobacterium sp. TaxID=1871053 RepID=UPI001A39433A|nr:enoyl-CoA hydratase-related protein [Phenylobacterium sp.]MBL8771775.1 enoyl-CoA hydratase/isomerase family protein [Phenylobacterium sp.]